MRALLVAALLTATVVPVAAQVDVPLSGIVLTITDPATGNDLAYASNGTIVATVKVGCLLAAQNAADPEVHVDAVNAPTWFTATDSHGEIDPEACVAGNGEATVTVNVPYSLSAAAPGVVPQSVSFMATLGETDSPADAFDFVVAYYSSYDVVPSLAFPAEVHGATLEFTVDVTQNSNARSMVMFEGVASTAGTFSGLEPLYYEPGQTQTLAVTFTAPATEWDNATVSFTTLGHWNIEGLGPGPLQDSRLHEWTFTNAGVVGPSSSESSGSSPGVGVALLAVLAFAAYAARRKA